MLTTREILFGILLPLLASGLLGLIPWLARMAWLIPLTVAAAFLIGYANSLGANGGFAFPRFPPSDGTDWLFWSAIPAVALAMLTPALPRHWKVLPALWAGVIVWIIVHPLVP